MIVFIAMLLVAAVAAGVLITTATSLQQKVVTIGEESLQEISTQLRFIQVMGENGTEGIVENLSVLARLAAGSDPINLNETLLSISLSNATARLQYAADPDLNNPLLAREYFTVTTNVQGPQSRAGYVNYGDIVTIYMVPPRNISQDEAVRITFVPKRGHVTATEFRTPSLMATMQVVLFP